MPQYVALGDIPPKRHTQHRDRAGRLRYEELRTADGFAGRSSLLYHLGVPSQLRSVDPGPSFESQQRTEWDGKAIVPHLLRTNNVPDGGDPITSRQIMLYNDDLAVSVARPTRSMEHFYANARGDELILVHKGSGSLHTPQGTVRFKPLDHLVIPRGTTWWIDLDEGVDQRWLVIEAEGEVAPPPHYRNTDGQYLVTAPYSERDFRPPADLETRDEVGEFPVLVKVGGAHHWYDYGRHPFDVVGWDGYLYPYALNLLDVETVTKAVHPAPPYFQTFQGRNFVTFGITPRPTEYYPGAIPAQPYHSSFDCDEVSYAITSPRGEGTMAFHPGFVPHGLPPSLYEASTSWDQFNVCVFLIDTFRPLRLSALAADYDDPGYLDQARS